MPHVLIVSADRRLRRLWTEWMASCPDLVLRDAVSLEEGLASQVGLPDVIVAPLADAPEFATLVESRADSPVVVLVADGRVPETLVAALDRSAPAGPRLVVAGEPDGASALLQAVESAFDLRQRRIEQAIVEACCTKVVLEYELDNDKSRITPLIDILLKRCDQFDLFDDRDRVRTQIALEEALLNSMIHGNLEVDSKLREEAGDEFGRTISLRQSIPYYADRRVVVRCELDRCGASFTIRDAGPGFDVSKVRDCRDSDRLSVASGRGVLLMRSFMDHVTYNAVGNEVQLQKHRSPSKPAAAPAAKPALTGFHCTAAR